MTQRTIAVETQDHLCRITLDRPERLNSFTADMHAELAAALERAEADDDVRAVLLTGAGRGFCAGQDLSERRAAPDGEAVDLGASIDRHYAPLIARLTTMPKPVVCAVNGVAAGAGVSIALACDIVVAARSARFVLSFARLGLVPDSGGTWILPRLVGQARALASALTGDPVTAEDAQRWGLIWQAVDDADLPGVAGALAARLATGPTLGHAATKRLIRDSWSRSLPEALVLERDALRTLGRSADYREGVSAFIDKRAPRYTGR